MNIQMELEQAKAAIRQGENDKARGILGKVLHQDPRNLDAWLLLAEAAQKPEHAIECLERALKLDPGNAIASLRLESLRAPKPSPNGDEDDPVNFEEFQSGEAERGVHFGSQLSYNPSTEQESVPAAIAASPVSTQPWNPPQPKAASPVSSRPAAKAKASAKNLEKLLFALIGLLILCILCGLGYPLIRAPLTGLTASRATPTPVNYAAVLYENIRASNSEDIQAYMTTIHPRSPAYATTQEMLKKLNATYDLSYKVSGVTVMQENNREVRLSFVLVTRKIRGPSFRNNQINGVMILRKDGEVWKIYNQEINNIQYLN